MPQNPGYHCDLQKGSTSGDEQEIKSAQSILAQLQQEHDTSAQSATAVAKLLSTDRQSTLDTLPVN
jgi:hypothetical protein